MCNANKVSKFDLHLFNSLFIDKYSNIMAINHWFAFRFRFVKEFTFAWYSSNQLSFVNCKSYIVKSFKQFFFLFQLSAIFSI